MDITIVAVPAKNDPVWKLSSEKIPHLTLLFLGSKVDNLERVEEYIRHAAKMTLSTFYLPVQERGVLGKDSADVLFFDKRDTQMLDNFRQNLLVDPDISTAYNSVEQYPSWTPHLTLGYPDNPAKVMPNGRDTIYSIDFDRIFLWTGEFEGVEFPLKYPNSDELAMSEKGKKYLEHYGTKGMHWGIRKAQAVSNSTAGKAVKKVYGPSDDAKKAKMVQLRAKVGGVKTLNNHEMQLVIRRMELEQRYRDLYGEQQYHDEAVSRAKRYSKRGARWAGRLINDILRDGGSSWIKRPGSNVSGRTSAQASAWATGQQFSNVLEGSFTEQRAIGQ